LVKHRRLSVWGLVAAATIGALAAGAGQAPAEKSIRFGDIVLRSFATAELELGVLARAEGPQTTVDAVDADRKMTAQLKASRISAYMSKPKGPARPERSVGRVERIEATGDVRFSGARKVDQGKGTVQVRASGTKAVYDRIALVLTLTGPVKFSAEQPNQSGSGTDVVDGKADRAVYDEGKRILQLFGDVEATVVTPDTPPEGSTFSGDEVSIDMSAEPYRVNIANPSLKGSINIRVREPGPAPKSDKPGR